MAATDRAALRDAYRALLGQWRMAGFLEDVPDPDLLLSLAATLAKVGQEVDRRRRETSGLRASQIDFDELVLELWTGPAPRPAAIDDDTIRHMMLLPYPDWPLVGREARTVVLHRLATMAQRPRAFAGLNADRYQRMLDEKQEQLELLIVRSGRAAPPAYVALFPTGSHNAEAMTIAGGTLILVNSGLMNLLYQLAKVNLASSSFRNEPPLIDSVQTSVALGEVLTAHTVAGSSFLARDLPPLDRGRLEIASKLTTLAEAFVIAHEYGHALDGHLDPRRTPVAVRTPAGTLELNSQRQEEEYEADRLAIEIIGPALRMPDSPRGEAIALSAVLLFFFVDLVVTRFDGIRGHAKPRPTTHPSSEERYARAREQLAGIATSPIAFDHAEALMLWFRAHEESILQLMADTSRMASDIEARPPGAS